MRRLSGHHVVMRHERSTTPRPGAGVRWPETPPDRERTGWWEHPNIDRPGARTHPATAAPRRTPSNERSSA